MEYRVNRRTGSDAEIFNNSMYQDQKTNLSE